MTSTQRRRDDGHRHYPATAAAALPFAGFATARPYPPTGLSTTLWAETVPVVLVALDRLYLTQDGVDIDALFGFTSHTDSDTYPHVVYWRGNCYLEDGHHRAVRAALHGKTHLLMRVFHADDDADREHWETS